MQQRVKYILAGLLALVGVLVAGRALFPPTPGTPRQSVSNRAPAEALPIASTLQAEFSDADRVRSEEAEDLAAKIAGTVRERLMALPAPERPSASDADALATEVGEIFAIYLTGDWERYLSYASSRGAELPMLDTPEEGTKARRFFESTVSTVKLRPVSLDEIVVRPRFLRGREIGQESLGSEATVTPPPTRYGLTQDAPRARLTVYETAVPVSYTWDGETSPMFISIWHAWSAERSRWLPWRLVLYDPTRKATIVPPPHP